ncbi:MAG: nucleotide exchange factor GrpE, partial [Bacteroidales bacterium]|nr:nucleotide exchange factor GrpE [Bacteroidales bacterium]
MKEHKKEKHSITETPVEEVKESVPVENPLQKELEELKDKYDSLNDKYIRLAAEFDNYRRRTAKEKLDLVLTAADDTVKGILTVLDDINKAIEVLKAEEGEH